jgi:NhaP-type Na+/H+ and K+/H+ antiporter
MTNILKWTAYIMAIPMAIIGMVIIGILTKSDIFFNITVVVIVSLTVQGVLSWIVFKRVE